MPTKTKDLTGLIVGYLTVINREPDEITGNKKRVVWKCKCVCGSYKNIKADALTKSHKTGIGTKSCGCKTSELCAKANTTHGHSRSRAGKIKRSREWCTHRSMLDRCLYPSHEASFKVS